MLLKGRNAVIYGGPRGSPARSTLRWMLPTKPVGQRVGDGWHLLLVENVHVEVQPEAPGFCLLKAVVPLAPCGLTAANAVSMVKH